jgi:hypothetical protein
MREDGRMHRGRMLEGMDRRSVSLILQRKLCRTKNAVRHAAALVLSFVFIPLMVVDARAELSAKNLVEITNVYLNHALQNSKRQVLKPQNKPLLFRPTCISQNRKKCEKSQIEGKILSSIARNQNNKLELSQHGAALNVIFADQSIVQNRRKQFNARYVNGFKDSNDPDCALYYDTNGTAISNISILISLDAPDFKQRMCLANQYFQGLGLSLADHKSFSELWDANPDALSMMTEEKFSRLVNGFSVFTLIHMCPAITNGMTLNDVVKVLRAEACWVGLLNK